jgi:hypothetical protein
VSSPPVSAMSPQVLNNDESRSADGAQE